MTLINDLGEDYRQDTIEGIDMDIEILQELEDTFTAGILSICTYLFSDGGEQLSTERITQINKELWQYTHNRFGTEIPNVH